MKSLLVSAFLTLTIAAPMAEACSLTPIGASIIQYEAVLERLQRFGQRNGQTINKITTYPNKFRAEINFERTNGTTYCRAYDYRIRINPDCSTDITSERGYYRCNP